MARLIYWFPPLDYHTFIILYANFLFFLFCFILPFFAPINYVHAQCTSTGMTISLPKNYIRSMINYHFFDNNFLRILLYKIVRIFYYYTYMNLKYLKSFWHNINYEFLYQFTNFSTKTLDVLYSKKCLID